MSSITVIENKAASIRKYLSILDRYSHRTRNELETDIDLRGAVERYLYLATQAGIDLAEAIIAHRRLRKPTTYGEAFIILGEAGILTSSLTESMVRMAGFRNVMAHDYGDLDYDVVWDVLINRLGQLEEFVQSIMRAMEP